MNTSTVHSPVKMSNFSSSNKVVIDPYSTKTGQDRNCELLSTSKKIFQFIIFNSVFFWRTLHFLVTN